MKESNFQNEFKLKNDHEGVFELKITKGKSIRTDALRDHQFEALKQANNGQGIYHKISDTPFIKGNPQRFTKKKPFDCFYLKTVPAYVVVMFYEPRKKKNVYYLTPFEWEMLGKWAWENERKSVPEDKVKEYASYNYNYLKK